MNICYFHLATQSCLTLCDPMDYSPPGSSVHGILQARIVKGVAMPSSRGSFHTRVGLLHCKQVFLPLRHQESPHELIPAIKYLFSVISHTFPLTLYSSDRVSKIHHLFDLPGLFFNSLSSIFLYLLILLILV